MIGIEARLSVAYVTELRSTVSVWVAELRAGLSALRGDSQGMIITTSGFSQSMTKVAGVRNAPLIVLIDSEQHQAICLSSVGSARR